MRNQEWNAALAQLHTLDFAQLVLRLFARNTVDGETTLGIVDEAEMLACLLDGDHVLEAGRICHVGANFAVDFDEALHEDLLDLAGVEGIFQAVDISSASSYKSQTPCALQSCARTGCGGR